jgi:hypothetical protein
MKDKVEMKYVSDDSGYWELTVSNKFIGEQVVRLDASNAMLIAMAIGTVRDLGRQEGYEKAHKKYKAIHKLSNFTTPLTTETNRPWDDADTPMRWNPEWKLNDPNK